MQIQYLLRELRSHMCGTAKKNFFKGIVHREGKVLVMIFSDWSQLLFSLLFSIGFSNQISVIIFSIPFIASLVLNTDFSSLMYLPCFL